MLLPPSQFRGSLHAHILLWVDDSDAERVKQEITATRCRYKTNTMPGGNVVYTDDVPAANCTARELRDYVDAKQMHKCRDRVGGCRYQRVTCQHGFPFAPNRDGTVYNEATKR